MDAASAPLDDAAFIAQTQALFDRTPRPIHSHFLVAATVVYVDAHGQQRTTQGVNTETCVLSSCICAERTALVQLRLQPTGWRYVRGVYITASSEGLITPGLLCREFLSEFSEAACAVREGHQGSDSEGSGGGSRGGAPADPAGDVAVVLFNASGAVARHALRALFPHPSPYHGVPNAQLLGAGRALAQRCAPPTAAALAPLLAVAAGGGSGGSSGSGASAAAAAAAALCAAVTALAAAPHEQDHLYPVHLAAGALFADGTVALARQLKGLEYGCSADAVVRLSGGLAAARPVALLVQSDQHGNLLAPSAPARALLTEHAQRLGLGAAALVLLHDAASGALLALPPAALASEAPDIRTGASP
jgi:cytidine deaminase